MTLTVQLKLPWLNGQRACSSSRGCLSKSLTSSSGQSGRASRSLLLRPTNLRTLQAPRLPSLNSDHRKLIIHYNLTLQIYLDIIGLQDLYKILESDLYMQMIYGKSVSCSCYIITCLHSSFMFLRGSQANFFFGSKFLSAPN